MDYDINFSNKYIPGTKGRLEMMGEVYDKMVFITKYRKMHSVNSRDTESNCSAMVSPESPFNNSDGLNVYPNPARERLYIETGKENIPGNY